jgi:DDE superfamily endonuclease
LVGLGRKTISGLLCATSQQFKDWSAAYRVFERERFDAEALFDPIRREAVDRIGPGEPLTVMIDDTLIRKRGRKVSGAAWRKDPLGPPFNTNFVWGQRFLQMSAALPDPAVPGRARAIPIEFTHAPTPAKPGKKATDQERADYRAKKKSMRLPYVAAQRLAKLRVKMDEDQQLSRRIIVSVDGGYTNRTFFRNLPHDTVAIGRIRKDARLFLTPAQEGGPGRRRFYGDPASTPEQVRKDESIPWIEVQAFAAGKIHSFEIKTIAPLRWRGTSSRDVRLVVIRPLAYRPRKSSPLLYRDPAYLLCTDTALPLDRLLQSYLWRWEVELNFRDEKTVLGVGEAQVRVPAAVETVPALMVGAYALLVLAGTKCEKGESVLPSPKWRTSDPAGRVSTAKLINIFRSELWRKAMRVNLGHFANKTQLGAKPCLLDMSLPSAVCYAIK